MLPSEVGAVYGSCLGLLFGDVALLTWSVDDLAVSCFFFGWVMFTTAYFSAGSA